MTTRDGSSRPLCPYCFSPVADDQFDCPSCQAAHHRMCYSENGGCAVLGCRPGAAGPEGQVPAAASAAASPSATQRTARQYRPGDIANGHVLTQNNEWVPLAPQSPTTPASYAPQPGAAAVGYGAPGALPVAQTASAGRGQPGWAAPMYGTAGSRGSAAATTNYPATAQPGGRQAYAPAPSSPAGGSATAGRKAAYWLGGVLAAVVVVILIASAGGSSNGSSSASNSESSASSYDSQVSVWVDFDSLESCYYADDIWEYEDVEVYDGDGNLLGSDYLTSDGADSYGDCQYSTYFDIDESSDGTYKIWVGNDYVTRYASDVEDGSLDVSLSAD